MQAASINDYPSGWKAQLTLGFTRADNRTVLSERRHSGPLQVQRPFYPESDGTCHTYILHPPGGVVGGDVLSVDAELASGASVLLTTPAAGKFYRSDSPIARQNQILRVKTGANLEWLPQETIVFEGARLHSLTRVELSGDGRFMGWEILCLGRPAAGELFGQGHCRVDFEIWRDDLPLYLEQGRYEGGSELLGAAWGLQGFPVTASLLCTTGNSGLTELVRSAVNYNKAEELFTVSQLDGVLVCRYLGPATQRARQLFGRAWLVLRSQILGKPPAVPRIWNT